MKRKSKDDLIKKIPPGLIKIFNTLGVSGILIILMTYWVGLSNKLTPGTLSIFILSAFISRINSQQADQAWHILIKVFKYLILRLRDIILILSFLIILLLLTYKNHLFFNNINLNDKSSKAVNQTVFIILLWVAIFITVAVLQKLFTKFLGKDHKITSSIHHLIKLLISTATLFIFLTGAEIWAQQYVNTHEYGPTGGYLGVLPDLYIDAPWDNALLFQERIINAEHMQEPPFITLDNHSGELFNIENHHRKTTNQPDECPNNIYFFGGSTVYNYEQPDYYTLPSYFQRLVNEAFPDTYCVQNMGISGITVYTQLDLLKTMDLQENDIVIFYDGINDAVQSGINRFFSKAGITKEKIFWPAHRWLEGHSYLYRFFLAPYVHRPAILDNEIYWEKSQGKTYEIYYQTILAANDFTTDNGAAFYHFLQPYLLTVSELSDYEKLLMKTQDIVSNGWAELHERNYPALVNANQDLRDADVITFDIRDALNPEHRPDGVEIFVDLQHLTHIGNEIIAERIFDTLLPYLEEHTQNLK